MIVVDDGSPEPASLDFETPWPVHIVRLPDKRVALNPCVAINNGVRRSSGDVLLLTNPEIVHCTPILDGMLAELVALGRKGYVAASCWGGRFWYCHPTAEPPATSLGRAPVPVDAGLHFCAMLYRDLFEEVGGFTESYRLGTGYEDNDFLWKLYEAGARFKKCGDLVTDHIRCPRTEWPAGGAERNRRVFNSRWPEHAHKLGDVG